MRNMDVVRQIRALGLSCKCYDGEFCIDYKYRDPRFRPDRVIKGQDIYGTSVYETDQESALATAKAMAAWSRI